MSIPIPDRFSKRRPDPATSTARRNLALRCMNPTGRSLEALHTTEMAERIQSASFRQAAAADSERELMEEIIAHMTDIAVLERGLPALSAAMLYFWPHELRELLPKHKLDDLPPWLVDNYVLWLSQPPMFFSEIGESKRYLDFLTGWTRYLHYSVVYRSHNPFWEKVADRYCANSGLTWAYFNDENLNELCTLRGELLYHALHWRGCQLSHEFSPRPADHRPIRLGILAYSFTATPETFATLPVFEHLDPEEFAVCLYCLREPTTAMEQYCASRATAMKVLAGDVQTQAATIRADDLDILWLARNVTSTSTRVAQLALHRLARRQVTGPGNIVTTGFPEMDFFVSGSYTDPAPDAQQQYSERLIKLEGSAHCFSRTGDDIKPTIAVTRLQLGIPADAIVYASDANLFKLTPELLNVWADILLAVPNSRLMLFPYGAAWGTKYPKSEFTDHLGAIFTERNLAEPGRVMIMDWQPAPNRLDILSFLKCADIYLDSFPFSGTTSLLEPLEAGLPIVTLRGHNFRTAMGAGMMQEIGPEDLIAPDEATYKEIATRLGTDPTFRRNMSAWTRQKMTDGPKFLDSKSFAQRIAPIFHEILSTNINPEPESE